MRKKLTSSQYRDLYDHGLLMENTYADGALKKIFAGVGQSIKDFGSILGSSAKLLMTDVNYLVTITFSRLKTIKEYNRIKEDFKKKRGAHINDITTKSKALMEKWPDGKIGAMMLAPGLVFTSQAVAGVSFVGSSDAKKHLSDMGFDHIPVLKWFSTMSDSDWVNAFEKLDPNDPEKSRIEFDRLMMASRGEGGPSSGILSKINSIFLFAHDEKVGYPLREAEGGKQPTKKQLKLFLKLMSEQIEEEWPIDREQYIQDRADYFEGIIDEAESVIAVNAKLSSTSDPQEFFELLKDLKKITKEKGEKLDVGAIEDGFAKMGKKIKDDEEAMSKIKEELTEDSDVDQKIGQICLDAMKGQFLVKLKEGLIEFYDYVYDEITEEMSEEQMKLINKNEYGKQFNKQVKQYKKRLGDALSNLG